MTETGQCLLRMGSAWFSGGLGSVRFVVGLEDLKGLFHPKWFYDCLILNSLEIEFPNLGRVR